MQLHPHSVSITSVSGSLALGWTFRTLLTWAGSSQKVLGFYLQVYSYTFANSQCYCTKSLMFMTRFALICSRHTPGWFHASSDNPLTICIGGKTVICFSLRIMAKMFILFYRKYGKGFVDGIKFLNQWTFKQNKIILNNKKTHPACVWPKSPFKKEILAFHKASGLCH